MPRPTRGSYTAEKAQPTLKPNLKQTHAVVAVNIKVTTPLVTYSRGRYNWVYAGAYL